MLLNYFKLFYSALNLTAGLLCFALFVWLMHNIWTKYETKSTYISLRSTVDIADKKSPPCITACPFQAFRTTGFHFNTSEFVRQSFDKEEVFYNNRNFNISQHVDSSKIIVEEIRSITAGRCYMVCAAKKLKKGEWFNIYFKRTLDIKVIIHSKEDKMWVGLDFLPIKMSIYEWDIISSSIAGTRGLIEQKQMRRLDKEDEHCKKYHDLPNEMNFNDCSKHFLTKYLMERINCSIPGLSEFTTNNSLEECSDAESAENVNNELEKILFTDKEPWMAQCPLPCKQIYYKLNYVNFHLTSIPKAVNTVKTFEPSFMLGMTYENFVVEKGLEKLAYDVADLFSQAGGNLGLSLGFSCLSFLMAAIDCLKKKLTRTMD